MTKPIVISLTIIGLMAWSAYTFSSPSREYWENVGPTWDRLLNPCKYEQCID